MGKKLLYKILTSFVCIFFFLSSICRAESLLNLQSMVDWSCVNFQIIGPCYTPNPPYVGVKVRYWEPVLLVETVKSPGDSVIDELGAVIKPLVQGAQSTLLEKATGVSIPITSGSSSSGTEATNLQFSEVHVYKFPFSDLTSPATAMSCGNSISALAPIIYLSELDGPEWRIGLLEALTPKSLISGAVAPFCAALKGHSLGLCMGYWGAVYPRRGFITHGSEVVSSAADAYRAVSISSLTDISFHTTLSKITFSPNPDLDKFQLLYPHPSGCSDIGENPALWETTKTSFNGKYVFVYWRYRECCVF